jgi:transcriptional regulator GlxA family with amidase domain
MADSSTGMQTESLPTRYGMLLFQAFKMLDVFGPLDPLQMLSRQYNMSLALISATPDPVMTRPRAPSMNSMNSSFFTSVIPTHTLKHAPDLDVLIVPDGIGTRAPDLQPTIDYIAASYPKLQYLVTVCTGAGLAARAGVLDGKKATTSKASWAGTIALGPKVRWVSKARWTVDGNVWTSSGISAGIDVTLAFIAHVYGDGVASGIAKLMEYERHQDPSQDPFATIFNITQP